MKKISGKLIRACLENAGYAKAGEYYDRFPPRLKNQKLFQLMHIRICQGMGNEPYVSALNEYNALFPNDPDMYLMMIDTCVLQKDYQKALQVVNKLDSSIDKDPFLDYYRGMMYNLMTNTTQSKTCLERLHVNMPGFGEGTVELIGIYLRTGEKDKAVKLFRESEGNRSVSPERLETLSKLYPGFKLK